MWDDRDGVLGEIRVLSGAGAGAGAGYVVGPASWTISMVATSNVARIMCLLFTNTSVGEQLCPHLFRLLALSRALYPLSRVHVASMDLSVILDFYEIFLLASLVWFLYDRKMIVHMNENVKELC